MTAWKTLHANSTATLPKVSRARRQPFQCQASSATQRSCQQVSNSDRRSVLHHVAGLAAALVMSLESAAFATSLPEEAVDESKLLCASECASNIDQIKTVNLPSGLQYKDIKEGTGPVPPVGFQVVANYVAMVPNGKIFDNSLEKGRPYDVRVGAGQVIPGLDEGMKSMKVGGIRRLYIPGNLAFPKGLSSGPGRPRVPPKSPVVFDVQLVLIPGLDADE
ncbi:hypothetical protein ABBQ32_004593 [Trebouxia sp. C0010 RCD-2024]